MTQGDTGAVSYTSSNPSDTLFLHYIDRWAGDSIDDGFELVLPVEVVTQQVTCDPLFSIRANHQLRLNVANDRVPGAVGWSSSPVETP